MKTSKTEMKQTIEVPFDSENMSNGGIKLDIIIAKDSHISGKLVITEVFPQNVSQSENEFEIDIDKLPALIGAINLSTTKITKIKSLLTELKDD